MQPKNEIIDWYNKTAKKYADKLIGELSKKHFDRMLLQTFASENVAPDKQRNICMIAA